MQSKEKSNKTRSTKKTTAEVPLPAAKVADIIGKSESIVQKVSIGKRRSDTPTGEKIELVQELWAEGSNLLIKEIKKIVKISNT